MKKSMVICACLLMLPAGQLFLAGPAHGQNPIYGRGQGYADQMVLDRMYLRRLKAKQAKHKANAKSSKRGTQGKTSSRTKRAQVVSTASAQPTKVVPLSTPSVHIKRDTYQDFHLDSREGYRVDFRFTPASGSGKTVLKSYTYNFYNNMADFGGLAAGKYRLTAQASYGGKKYPAHIGSETGTPSNPRGGNFAPSMVVEIKPGIDSYGYRSLQSSPEELQVRVIE